MDSSTYIFYNVSTEVKKMEYFILVLIGLWTFILAGIMFIGGYFMFRKFLKSLPKQDGMSELDWQKFYIDEALPLWNDDAKHTLNELVTPVPELFRDVAKEKIAGRISKIALDKNVETITLPEIIKGYIVATPKQDHKFLRKKLTEMNIDYSEYEALFEVSKGYKEEDSIFEQTAYVKRRS